MQTKGITKCVYTDSKQQGHRHGHKRVQFKWQHEYHNWIHHWVEILVDLDVVHHQSLYQYYKYKNQAIFYPTIVHYHSTNLPQVQFALLLKGFLRQKRDKLN